MADTPVTQKEATKMNEDEEILREIWEEVEKEVEHESEIEKLLVKNGLWNKVESHRNTKTCALCDKEFQYSEKVQFFLGKPLHNNCIQQLRKKVP